MFTHSNNIFPITSLLLIGSITTKEIILVFYSKSAHAYYHPTWKSIFELWEASLQNEMTATYWQTLFLWSRSQHVQAHWSWGSRLLNSGTCIATWAIHWWGGWWGSVPPFLELLPILGVMLPRRALTCSSTPNCRTLIICLQYSADARSKQTARRVCIQLVIIISIQLYHRPIAHP